MYSHTELMYLSRCTHAHSLPFFRSFTNHSSLSPASRRAWGDYYVNECERGGGGREGGRGVRLSVRGVLLFLFSLSPYIAPRITAISTPEEYFNIRYSTPPLPSAPPVPDSCWETQRETERKRERGESKWTMERRFRSLVRCLPRQCLYVSQTHS